MVQEVQQQGNWYQTPNEIQGIGDIRRRVREHTQVTPSFTYECKVNGSTPSTPLYAHETKTVMGTITSITESYGNTVFKLSDGGLQIPLAGAYLVEFSGNGWTQYVYYTHTLMVDNIDILSMQNTNSGRISTSKVLNFGKGNVIKYKATIINTAEGSGTYNTQMTLTLKRL